MQSSGRRENNPSSSSGSTMYARGSNLIYDRDYIIVSFVPACPELSLQMSGFLRQEKFYFSRAAPYLVNCSRWAIGTFRRAINLKAVKVWFFLGSERRSLFWCVKTFMNRSIFFMKGLENIPDLMILDGYVNCAKLGLLVNFYITLDRV